MEDTNNYIDIEPEDIEDVEYLEDSEEVNKEEIKEVDIIDEILEDIGEIEGKDNNKINILEILKSPIFQPFIKQGLEMLLKNLAKQKMTQVVAAKGSKHITDNILNLTGKPSYKKMKKKGVKGKKQYKEIINYRETFIKENFRATIEEQIKSSVINKKIF